MMITETVLRTLGICGLVGAGTVAINEVSRVQKKKKAVLPVVEEEKSTEDENAQECKEIPNTTFSVDSAKLEKILLEASYPQDQVKQFVQTIKEQAAPEETTVQVELVNETPKAPTFTVVEEPKITQPNFSKNGNGKKPNTKNQKPNTNNKKN